MGNPINTKGDGVGYDRNTCKRQIYDENALLSAFFLCRKNTAWKHSAQLFESNLALEIATLAKQIEDRSFRFTATRDFVLHERGKIRYISGETVRNRVVKKAICQEVLLPAILPHLIYDNGASQKGKGVDFTRRRLLAHLRRFYREHGNDGYILLMDYSKYYDNIQHEKLLEIFRRFVSDETTLWLIEQSLQQSAVDVSYMTDTDYANCLDILFDNLEHQKTDKSLLTGEKMMRKHVNLGDEISQIAGLCYPMDIDNFIKIVRRCKYYARYMDDSYLIAKDKNCLISLRNEIENKAHELGLTLNPKKTRIVKLSSSWRFMQVQYSLTGTGRVIQKIRPERLTRMRRKLKKLAGKLPEHDFDNLYRSWFKGHYKLMSKKQRQNLDKLYKRSKEEKYGLHD